MPEGFPGFTLCRLLKLSSVWRGNRSSNSGFSINTKPISEEADKLILVQSISCGTKIILQFMISCSASENRISLYLSNKDCPGSISKDNNKFQQDETIVYKAAGSPRTKIDFYHLPLPSRTTFKICPLPWALLPPSGFTLFAEMTQILNSN